MEATDSIAQWEARFSALGENEGAVVRQCEERVRSLEAQLQMKEDEASESHSKFSQAEQSLTAAKDEMSKIIQQSVTLESTVAMMTSQVDILNQQIDEKLKVIENMQLYIRLQCLNLFLPLLDNVTTSLFKSHASVLPKSNRLSCLILLLLKLIF